jgi:uncharacterized Zn finger protein
MAAKKKRAIKSAKKKAAAKKLSPKEREERRIAEYVDSRRMTQRLRNGDVISARIEGNYGDYRTEVRVRGKKVEGECSCPSEYWPCKHVFALRRTSEKKPESFLDWQWFLGELTGYSQEKLIEAIGRMVVERPGHLVGFGVPGFEIAEELDEDGEWAEDEWDGN